MPKLYLTDAFIRDARCPPLKDQEIYWDHPRLRNGGLRHGSVSGLGLRVTAQGNLSFVHSYRFNGQRRRKAIGTPTTMSVGSARLVIRQREQRLAAGENPDQNQFDPRKKHSLNVNDVIQRHWHEHVCQLSDKSRAKYLRFVGGPPRPVSDSATKRGQNKRLSTVSFERMFSEHTFTAIRPTEVQRFLAQFNSSHNHNAALALLKTLFNWAIRMQLVDMRNPCSPFRMQKTIRERRDYTPEQIQAIAKHIFAPVLELSPPVTAADGKARRDAALERGRLTNQNAQMVELCNFMGILLLTMARPTEVMQAEFAHFDLEQLVWHKHNTKGIKLSRATYEYAYRSVPIHPKVAELVRAQRERWPDAALIFPSHTDPTKPRDNFRKSLARFKRLDGVPNYFQMYDLKRIAISLMLVGQGVRREDVSHYVDHKGNLETTMIYDLGFVDPMRPVTDKLGQLLGLK